MEMTREVRKLICSALMIAVVVPASIHRSYADEYGSIKSELVDFRIQEVVKGLQIPWALAFLPDGKALVSDRAAGHILLVDLDAGEVTPLAGGPDDVFIKDSAGMLDVVLHPDFTNNRWVYYSYTAGDALLSTTVVERARLVGNSLKDRERIFEALPWYHFSEIYTIFNHYGCRLAFHGDYLFVTMGDRWDLRHLSQSPGTHLGKVLRLHHDGRVPADNPFVGQQGALPEVWTLGNRNAQGLVVHPVSGDLWEHEHGPMGGDEVNVIEAGHNYGWPVITYGMEYSGEPIGDGLTEMEGMEQPIHKYVPSIGPSDMFFYTGSAFPEWRGNLFIGALALRHINRLVVEGREVVHEERMLEEQKWRIRFVKQGPDDLIYFGTDEGDIFRLLPIDGS
jgi:glucose/arabinose dehydrogenase